MKPEYNNWMPNLLRCVGLLCVITLGLMTTIGSGPGGSTVREEPGWYGFSQGWNYWDSDVKGKVGHRLHVSTPRGKCKPGGYHWTDVSVISGSLPPGLSLNSAPWTITGISTKRGHWIVRMKLDNVKCGGKYYKGFEQELRFHITGSGRVIQ